MHSGYRFMYLRDENRFPVACLAMAYDKLLNSVNVGISTVHPNDMKTSFSKSVARRLAVGAAVLGPLTVPMTTLPFKITTHDITWDVLLALEANKAVPTRVRKAITLWFTKADALDLVEEANAVIEGESSMKVALMDPPSIIEDAPLISTGMRHISVPHSSYNPLISYRKSLKKPGPIGSFLYPAVKTPAPRLGF